MLLRPCYFIGLQLILLVNIAQCFVLLTANIEDVKKIARKFVSEPMANQIAQFIAKASGQTITLPKGVSEENSVNSDDEESADDAVQYHTNERHKNHGLPKQRYKKQTRPTTPEAVKIEYVVDPLQGDDNEIDNDANKFSLDSNLNQPAYKEKKIIKMKKPVHYNTVYKEPRAEAHTYRERNERESVKRPLRAKALRKPAVKIKSTSQPDYKEGDNQMEPEDVAEANGYEQDVQYEVTIQAQIPKPMPIKLRQNKAQPLKPSMERKPMQKMTTKNIRHKKDYYNDQGDENNQEYQDEDKYDIENEAIKDPVRNNQNNGINYSRNKGNQGYKHHNNKNNIINDARIEDNWEVNSNKKKEPIRGSKINNNGNQNGEENPYNKVSYWVNLGSENKDKSQVQTAKQINKLRPNKLLAITNQGSANSNYRPKQGLGNNKGYGRENLNQVGQGGPNQVSKRWPNQGPVRGYTGDMQGSNQKPNQGQNQGGQPNMNQENQPNMNQGNRPNVNQGNRPNMNQGNRPNMYQGNRPNIKPNMNQGSLQNTNVGKNQNQVRQQNRFGNNKTPRQVQRFKGLRTTARDRMGSSEWMPGARSVLPYRKPNTRGRFALLHAVTTASQNKETETTADKQDRGEDNKNNDQQEAQDNNEDQTNNLDEGKDEADAENLVEPNDLQAEDDDANINLSTRAPENDVDANDSLNNQDNLAQQDELLENDIKYEEKSQEPEGDPAKDNPYLKDTEDTNPTEATTMTLVIENFADGVEQSNVDNRAMEMSTRKEGKNEFDQYDLPRVHSTTEQADITKEDLEPRAQMHEGRIKPSRLLPDEDLQITYQKVPKDEEDKVTHKQGPMTIIDKQFTNVTSTETTSVVNNEEETGDGKKTQIILKL